MCSVYTYVSCSFVHSILYVCSHTHNYLFRVLCKRPCSGMALSNMGYLKQIMLGDY